MESVEKNLNKDAAMTFLQKVAEAERLVTEVHKGDVFNTVRVAKANGYEVSVKDLWDAVVHLQSSHPENIPGWIVQRLRVSVHD